MRNSELNVWKVSIELTIAIYKLSNKLPEDEKYGLVSQIRRSSVSIPSNISEGLARNSGKSIIHFLNIARGSLAELKTQIILIQKIYDIKADKEEELLGKVAKLLSGTIKYFRNKQSENNKVNEPQEDYSPENPDSNDEVPDDILDATHDIQHTIYDIPNRKVDDEFDQDAIDGSQFLTANRHVTVHESPFFAHETAVIDEDCKIGKGTKIWHFSHIMSHCQIGKNCNIGQNVVVSPYVKLGKNVKVQNNVSIYTGVICEDDVFLGPSMVFTNIVNPRSAVIRKDQYVKTLVEKGVSIGANATIVCGHTIGQFAFIGAGAVVTKEVKPYALVVGNPARQVGWMSEYGHRLNFDDQGFAVCSESGEEYKLDKDHVSKVETGDGKRETGNGRRETES